MQQRISFFNGTLWVMVFAAVALLLLPGAEAGPRMERVGGLGLISDSIEATFSVWKAFWSLWHF